MISSSQSALPDNTQHSQEIDNHAPRWDLNPQSQHTYALDSAVTGTDIYDTMCHFISIAAQHATFIRDKYPCLLWYSKPQSQEAKGH
jgi:hypothetical protein